MQMKALMSSYGYYDGFTTAEYSRSFNNYLPFKIDDLKGYHVFQLAWNSYVRDSNSPISSRGSKSHDNPIMVLLVKAGSGYGGYRAFSCLR